MTIQTGDYDFAVGGERISRFESEPLADGMALGFVAYRLDLPDCDKLAGASFVRDDPYPFTNGEPTPRGYYFAHFYTRAGAVVAPLVRDDGQGQQMLMVAITADAPEQFNTDQQFRDLVRMRYGEIVAARGATARPEGEHYTEAVAPPIAP